MPFGVARNEKQFKRFVFSIEINNWLSYWPLLSTNLNSFLFSSESANETDKFDESFRRDRYFHERDHAQCEYCGWRTIHSTNANQNIFDRKLQIEIQ